MSISQPFDDRRVSISSLVRRICSLAEDIESHLSDSNFPQPTFAPDAGSVPETAEYEALRAPLNDAALDLLRLVNGPKSTLRTMFFSHYDLAALQVALDRRIFTAVPLPPPSDMNAVTAVPASATVAEVASRVGMDEDRTGRVMKLLATHRIFEKVDTNETGVGGGSFKHTASSAVLARDPDFHATADMQMDDMLRAASETSVLVTRFPQESDATHCAFHHRFGMPMYQYYEENPKKAKRFAQAMSSWSQIDRQISELCDSYPWAGLRGGKVVDIGGGSGHISIALARLYPSLNFVVQDISTHMLSHTQADLGGRVTFQQHDFFTPQPVHGNDVAAFLLRQCLHNYNDADALRILRAVVPALERCASGTPLLLNDVIMPESGSRNDVTRFEEHHLRQVDFCMLVGFGGKQRSEADFRRLLRDADQRFAIRRVYPNPMGVGLLEAYLSVAG